MSIQRDSLSEIPPAPRCVGRFKASAHFVVKCWPECQMLFREVVPVAISWDVNGVAEYTAYSKMFREIQEGETPPLYEITFNRTNGLLHMRCTGPER